MDDDARTHVPIYVLLDASASMVWILPDLRAALQEFVTDMRRSPFASDLGHLAVVTFSDDARVALPLTEVSEIEGIPDLDARGGTAFTPVFNLTAGLITEDVVRLRKTGRVYRPSVIVLSDGVPIDPESSWRRALHGLKSTRANVIAFGMGDADPRILGEIASRPDLALLAVPSSMSPASSFLELLLGMTQTLGSSLLQGSRQSALELPDGLSTVPDFNL